MRYPTLRTPLLLAMLLLPCVPAGASDGVVEINRTCAVQTGCFPFDTAGYPVTITGAAGRSYRLTSDLFISGQSTTAIEIKANEITIDLAGFRISCTDFVPPSTIQPCSAAGPGTGSGIAADDSIIRSGVEVRNGSVFGTPGTGVSLGDRSVIRDLRVTESGSHGILARVGCIIEGNTAALNADIGIFVASGATVSGNTAHQNGFNGIQAGDGSILSGNAAFRNGQNGISVSKGSTVSGNSVWDNAGIGIFGSFNSTLSGNTATESGSHGIVASDGSVVHGNSASGNSGFGLVLGSGGYRENVIDGNAGTVNGGVDLGGNACNGSTTCP